MSESFEDSYLPPPPEFDGAPLWAHAMWRQHRRDQHRNAREFMLIQADLRDVKKALGNEPDSDGKGGKGLLGDVHRFKALRAQGMGFIAAIALTWAILVYGLIYWIQSILPKAPASN